MRIMKNLPTLAFHGCGLIVRSRGAVRGTGTVVQLRRGLGARLAVIGQGSETGAAGGVAGATAALLHVVIVPRGAAGLTGAIQDQVQEAASWNHILFTQLFKEYSLILLGNMFIFHFPIDRYIRHSIYVYS